MSLSHFELTFEPQADPAAIVLGPQVRFTVLTSRLIRLEYSPSETFEERASQPFWYRRQPTPPFEARQSDDLVEIETGHLHLRYRPAEQGFTPATLSIHVKATGATWHFGDHHWKSGNLLGTTRTLDATNGHATLEMGLMARRGWAIVDDSRTLVFDSEGWLTEREAPDNLDLYFFGYGNDYVACLQDFQRVAGPTPLIPRWALGNWWSRYWAYTQEELQALLESFQARQMPLSVCIIDMDWHITETGNPSVGWTGYTWNRDLFPDPAGFIDWLHQQGLKTALNLHPADGVFPHEEQYEAMAEATGIEPTSPGIEPTSQVPVPFDIADPQFADAYFRLLHHPHEAAGIDFWWMDWQQGTQSKMKGLDPLWWLNHLHFYDLGRDGEKRPFIFSRWGGLGNHRYPIGFSGDTVTSWESLAYQPFFTATAANVGYGWWSHDIGGHMWGIEEAELYVRWLQFGVFSPILRLHSSNNPYSERRPWAWGAEAEAVARQAMQLRHALIPYLYTMAWRNHRVGLPLVTPLYYTHPDNDNAYRCPQQYWFGTELLAAPFTSPAVPELGLSRQRVWLPDGDWYNFFSGERYAGGWHVVYGDLSDIPLFARAGAIVPLGPKTNWNGIDNPAEMYLYVFVGENSSFYLYEDDGRTTAYQRDHYALTSFAQQWDQDGLIFTISPVSGDTSLAPPQRTYHLLFHGIVEPEQITLALNEEEISPAGAAYNAQTGTLHVTPPAVTPTDGLSLRLTGRQPTLLARQDRRAETVRRMLRAFKLDVRVKEQIDNDLPRLLTGDLSLTAYHLTDAQAGALETALSI